MKTKTMLLWIFVTILCIITLTYFASKTQMAPAYIQIELMREHPEGYGCTYKVKYFNDTTEVGDKYSGYLRDDNCTLKNYKTFKLEPIIKTTKR